MLRIRLAALLLAVLTASCTGSGLIDDVLVWGNRVTPPTSAR